MINNLTTKNFFTTKRLHEEITTKAFTKTGVNAHIQQYKYLLIISKLITDQSFHKGEYVGCKLNTKNLTILYGNKHAQTCAIIKDLDNWGFIHKTANAVIGSDAARYALTDKYANDGILVLPVDISDAGFVKKLIDYDKIENNKILKQLGNNIYNLSINNNGISYLSNKYDINTIDGVLDSKTGLRLSKTTISGDETSKFLLRGVEIDMGDLPLIQIYLKDFNTSRPDPKSRVYNNLTNLKREFRKFIHFNGKPLMMTDISNCQVLLSVAAVKKQYSITSGMGMLGLYEDVKHYQQLAESGMFYEYLIERSGYTGDRNKFKKDFFSQVFFSKVVKYSMPIKDAFVDEFPNVYNLINQLKAKDYKEFAVSMQKMEASIMIDTVAKKMIKQGKSILTLHDAIVCDNVADLELAEQLISDAMVPYKITPKFKRESSEVVLANMDGIPSEIIDSIDAFPVIEADRELIQHSFGEILIQNYNDFKSATASLTDDDVQTLINRFAVSSMGYNSFVVNNVIYNFMVKYEEIEGEEDELMIIVFKEKIIRKLVA